jgi:hypothetical protein
MSYVDFSVLKGKTLTEIRDLDNRLDFYTEDEKHYSMYHSQDCCESVYIESITGDLKDLIGTPILVADESVNRDKHPEDSKKSSDIFYDDSFTWTFYKLDTIKGGVTIRWYGSSNGYYSESVELVEV